MAHAATNLRQEIAICTKAPELIRTLKRHEECIDASDVFAAWEVVLRRNLLSFQSKGGSRGETGQGKRETKGKAAEPVAVAELRGLLMEYTMPRIGFFAPRELSVIARAMVSTKSGGVKDVLMISEEIGGKLVSFEPHELCMVLWAVSSHTGLSKDEKHNLFLSLSSLVEKGMGMDLFMAHDLSILVWSMGVVGFQSAQLIEAAERESVNKIEDFDTGSVARMMHGFAELRYNPNTLLPLMTARYEDSINAFSPQDFTLMLVSLGKLVTEPSLKFLRRSAKRAKELLPQEDASTQRPCLDVHLNAQLLWAFARLGVKRTAFTTHSLKYVMVNMEEHTVEDLSAVLWACCRLGDLKLPAGFVQQAVSTLRSLDPASAPQSYAQCLRYILILYYRYKETSKVDILAIEADMVFMLENLVPSVCSLSNWDLCTLVIALSPVPIRLKPEFVRIFQEEVARSIESLPSSLIPKLAFAVGKLRWSSSSKLIEGLAAAIEKKGGLISADGLVQIAYSFASFRKPNPKLTESLARNLIPKIHLLHVRDKARAAFAFSRLRASGTSVTSSVVKTIQATDVKQMDASSLFALLQATESLDKCDRKLIDTLAVTIRNNANMYDSRKLSIMYVALKKHGCSQISALDALAKFSDVST